MDEKYIEIVQEQAAKALEATIKNRKQYVEHATHCLNPDCGVELPEVRQSIGTCIDCARQTELAELERRRLYGR